MNSTIHANQHIAQLWFAAFNAHQLEDLLNLYHPEAIHYSPKLKISQPATNGLINGRTALHAWWQDAFNRLPSLQYTVVKLTVDEEQVFMEYIRKVDNEADLKVGEVLEIENGLIVSSRVYHG